MIDRLRMAPQVMRDIDPARFFTREIADDSHHWKPITCPRFKVGFVRVEEEASVADVRRAGLYLNKNTIAAWLTLVIEKLDQAINAKVCVLKRPEYRAGIRSDLTDKRYAALPGLRGGGILGSHRSEWR